MGSNRRARSEPAALTRFCQARTLRNPVPLIEPMPSFQVLQCYSDACRLYQVQQEKKSKKWTCTVCGSKQSLQRVFFASSAASDCRKAVQQLNARKIEVTEQIQQQIMADRLNSSANERSPEKVAEERHALPISNVPKPDWSLYVEDEPHADDGDTLPSPDQQLLTGRRSGKRQSIGNVSERPTKRVADAIVELPAARSGRKGNMFSALRKKPSTSALSLNTRPACASFEHTSLDIMAPSSIRKSRELPADNGAAPASSPRPGRLADYPYVPPKKHTSPPNPPSILYDPSATPRAPRAPSLTSTAWNDFLDETEEEDVFTDL
ncbi:hypothetical protein BC832DRAFT_110581 [Gaertneriomyces semiglobifer]|nr:hypothetical protein BC832DRAFT_110581 [Gaertneriomyces semiglobifer]